MATANALLMTFVVNGSITKYISTEAVAKSRLYTPQIISPPTFELSGEGYVSAGFGSFSVVNNPYDSDTVFNYIDETYPVANKAYAITFSWGEQASDLFSGSAVLRKVTDKAVEFDLVAPEYSQDLLEFTQSKSRVSVTNVADSAGGSGNTVRITAANHNIPDGSEVIFEGMTTATELNYDGTASTVYTVSVVSTSTFDLDGTNSNNFTLGAESAGSVDITTVRPMAFGEVTHKVPIEKSTTLVSNPHLDHTKIIRVYEDGVNIAAGKSTSTQTNVSAVTAASTTTYTVASHEFIVGDLITPASFGDSSYHVQQTVTSVTSTTVVTSLDSTGFSTASPGNIDFTNVFSTAPTATNITLNSASGGGEMSVSGTGVNGSTLSTIFTYIVGELSLSLNTSKASSASSLNLAFYIDSQIKVIDLADKICRNINYQFFISGSTLYLVDKANDPSATEIINPDIELIDHDYMFPSKQFISTWTHRVPFTGTDKRLGSEERSQFVNSSNFAVGNTTNIDNLVETEIAQKSILQTILTTHEKPVITLVMPFIEFSYVVGDKFEFIDNEKLISYTMKIRSISFNFSEEKTTFKGDGTASTITRTNMRT